MNQNKHFLRIAIEEASKASWPFGAVVVKNGEIISQAGSGDGKDNDFDPTAHAEVNAIRMACEKLKTTDLSGSVLYASCEPCAICFGTAWYTNIREIVYSSSLDDIQKINKAWGGDLAFPHDHIAETDIVVFSGILKDEAANMYASHPRVTNSKI